MGKIWTFAFLTFPELRIFPDSTLISDRYNIIEGSENTFKKSIV